MSRRRTINTVNLCLLILSFYLMFAPNTHPIMLLGVGLFLASVFNLVFNNIPKNK